MSNPKYLLVWSLMLCFGSQSFAQDEGVEEPSLGSPSEFDESTETAEEDVMNQLEQLNEVSSASLEFKAFIYSGKGRKNPFSKPSSLEAVKEEFVGEEQGRTGGLEGYDISSFQLTTVMWDVKHPKALVKASETETFVIEEGTKIGRSNGYVAKIREGEVIIIESSLSTDKGASTVYKTQVLKLGR
jgi:Tfp pilus assembly protein PilP